MHGPKAAKQLRHLRMPKSRNFSQTLCSVVTSTLPGLHDFACTQRAALCLASSTSHLPSSKLSGIEEECALPPLAFNGE